MGDGHGRRARATGHGHQVWLPEARAARRAPSSPRGAAGISDSSLDNLPFMRYIL